MSPFHWQRYSKKPLSWWPKADLCVCRVQLFAIPWTVACQASLSTGFSRQKYWFGLPFPTPGDLPNQGSNSHLLHWKADSLLLHHLLILTKSNRKPSRELNIEDRRSLEAWVCLSTKVMSEVRVLVPPTYTIKNSITTSTINFGNMNVFHGPWQSERLWTERDFTTCEAIASGIN